MIIGHLIFNRGRNDELFWRVGLLDIILRGVGIIGCYCRCSVLMNFVLNSLY